MQEHEIRDRAGSGDLVAFRDDDDEWLPSKIEEQAELLRYGEDFDWIRAAERLHRGGGGAVGPVDGCRMRWVQNA